MQKDVRVSISGGTISVNPSTPVGVSKKGQDTVSWFSNDGPFEIRFHPGSQINNPSITQQGNTWQGSIGPIADSVSNGPRKYDVVAGSTVLDPEVDIQP